MTLQETLKQTIQKAFTKIYNVSIDTVEFQATRKDFAGDITVVVFPFLRVVKGNPVEIATKLGEFIKENVEAVAGYNVVKGFLNIELSDSYFLEQFNGIYQTENYGIAPLKADEKAVMVEYSSPNTNKPLHLGHIRNNLLGYSVAEILKASGKKVYKTQIINDRGIHICKSMLAWQRFGNGETPQSTGLKGDKLVGNCYVKFEKELQKQAEPIFEEYRSGNVISHMTISGAEIQTRNGIISRLEEEKKELQDSNRVIEINKEINEHLSKIKKVARDRTELMGKAQEMLRKWESGDEEVVNLWKTMNGWVYDGFEITYKNLGVDFDKLYYESDTYLLGKEFVEEGLKTGVFFKKDDGSVWCDLTDEGLDEKIVLRADGTAVYMTQDIGTAIQRIKDHSDVGGLVYTVGNEQDYHFKVLFLILKKLGFDWAKNLYHLSYGMVDLPSGKMKSREGTVVDADDLIVEMANTAREISEELGKLEGYSEQEKEELYKTIGLGALKYFILKVDPKKRILFDPAASIDFQGNTGPFIQYAYARIQSILRKAGFDLSVISNQREISLNEKERNLLKQLSLFPETVQQAADNYSPALIANYTYDLVKEYNSFYQSVPILGSENEQEKIFRTQLSKKVAEVIKSAFALLGIDVPERM